MGSRCYACGEKFGRCYEHGGACECVMHSCGPEVAAGDDSGGRVDVGADVDLVGLRAAARAATSGPWVAEPDTHAGRVWVQLGKPWWGTPDLEPIFQARPLTEESKAQRVADAAYIAAADPPTILALIARVEAAESVATATRGLATRYANGIGCQRCEADQ